MRSASAMVRAKKSTTAAPTNTVAPVASQAMGDPCAFSGNYTSLTATTGTWTGSPTSYGYQWQGSNTSSSGPWTNWTSGIPAYVGQNVTAFYTYARVQVIATNAGGSTTANSAAITVTDYGCATC